MKLYAIFKTSIGKWDYFSFNGNQPKEGFVIFANEEQVLDLLKGLNKTLNVA
jgi:hypothetical protein